MFGLCLTRYQGASIPLTAAPNKPETCERKCDVNKITSYTLPKKCTLCTIVRSKINHAVKNYHNYIDRFHCKRSLHTERRAVACGHFEFSGNHLNTALQTCDRVMRNAYRIFSGKKVN